MEELFQIIGRLYTDIYHSQKFLENLQEQIKSKDSEIINLKSKLRELNKDTLDK